MENSKNIKRPTTGVEQPCCPSSSCDYQFSHPLNPLNSSAESIPNCLKDRRPDVTKISSQFIRKLSNKSFKIKGKERTDSSTELGRITSEPRTKRKKHTYVYILSRIEWKTRDSFFFCTTVRVGI